MAALGARDELLRIPLIGEFARSHKADLMWTRTASDGITGSAEAEAGRVRATLEGRWSLPLGNFGEIAQHSEAELRHDSGDAEAGWGVEVGGGLTWQHAASGLDLSVESRGLASHEDSEFRFVGYSASLGWDVRPQSEHGLSLQVRQDSDATSSGVQQLFSSTTSATSSMSAPGNFGGGFGASGFSEKRWSAEAAWGVPMFDDQFIGVPYLNRNWSERDSDTTVGWRLAPVDEQAIKIKIDFQTVLRAQQSGGYFGGFEYEPVGGVDGIDDVSEQVESGLEIQADF